MAMMIGLPLDQAVEKFREYTTTEIDRLQAELDATEKNVGIKITYVWNT